MKVIYITQLDLTNHKKLYSSLGMLETELQEALENIICSNLYLRLENDIFERYLARRDPESIQSNFLNQFLFMLNFSEILTFLF